MEDDATERPPEEPTDETATEAADGGDTDSPTIIEEEVGEVADLVTGVVVEVTTWVNENILNFVAIWQLAAIGGTLFLAIVGRRSFSRLLEKLGGEAKLGPVLNRIIHTLAAISLPVVWAIGLWICTAVFIQFDLPIPFLRLVSSLLNAFILIRIVSIFIPSTYWSAVFAWVAWGVAALNAVGVLDPVITWMQATGFSIGEADINLWVVVKGILVTALLIWGALAIAETITRRLDANTKISSALKLLIGKSLRIVLVIIASVIGLTAVGVDLTAFAVFSGAVGIGVGLGLQQTVSNLFAGFSLLAERSIEPGDVIEVETTQGATYGVVTKMTTRYVAVRTRDNTETIIPNQTIISSPVTNWSMTEALIRRKVAVGVSYDTDLNLAIRLCKEAAAATPRVLEDPPVACLLKGFGDNSVDLELRYWISDPQNGISNLASAVLLNVWERFKEHDIEIPFPQRDLHLRSAVPLVVSDTPLPKDTGLSGE